MLQQNSIRWQLSLLLLDFLLQKFQLHVLLSVVGDYDVYPSSTWKAGIASNLTVYLTDEVAFEWIVDHASEELVEATTDKLEEPKLGPIVALDVMRMCQLLCEVQLLCSAGGAQVHILGNIFPIILHWII